MDNAKLTAKNILENTNLKKPREVQVMCDILSTLLTRSRFDIVDEVLIDLDVNQLDYNGMMDIIITTFPASNRLKNRKKVFEQVRSNLLKIKDKQKVDKVLKGLE